MHLAFIHATSGGLTTLESDADGQCCYSAPPYCAGGRPFLVNGVPRISALDHTRSSARASAASEALRESWLQDALMEHASVAAFARLSLRLMSFGAPAELVRESQAASLDELRHAAFCFEQAARHGARATPSALDLTAAFQEQTFEAFVLENLQEGCVGETLAALRASEQACRAMDPEVRVGLAAIAEDEARHAELAFRILRWCVAVEPAATARALTQVLHAAVPARPSGVVVPQPAWSAAGRLSLDEGRRLDHASWHATLQPLLGEALEHARALTATRASVSHGRGSSSSTPIAL